MRTLSEVDRRNVQKIVEMLNKYQDGAKVGMALIELLNKNKSALKEAIAHE